MSYERTTPLHPALRERDENLELRRQNRDMQLGMEQQATQLAQAQAGLDEANRVTAGLMAEREAGLQRQGLQQGPQDGMGPNGPQGDPVDMLVDAVQQGASFDELAELGMVDAAAMSMQEQGISAESQSELFQELYTMSSKPGQNQFSMA